MRMLKTTLAVLIALLCVAPAAQADEVMIHDPLAYETADGMKVGAAMIGLHSAVDDKLIGASSPVSERVEIHTMTNDNDIMRMRKIDELALPADKIVTMSPDGYHLMLMNLKEPLKAGAEFPITLKFEKAGEQTVTVPVQSRKELMKALDATPAKDDSHSHHD